MANRKIRKTFLRKSVTFSFRSVVLFAVAFAAVSAAALWQVLAAPHNSGTLSATIASDCNPCAVGSIGHITGRGFDGSWPRGDAAFVNSEGNATWIGININSDGTTAFEWYMVPKDTYKILVNQTIRKKPVLKAELDGIVVQ